MHVYITINKLETLWLTFSKAFHFAAFNLPLSLLGEPYNLHHSCLSMSCCYIFQEQENGREISREENFHRLMQFTIFFHN